MRYKRIVSELFLETTKTSNNTWDTKSIRFFSNF